MLGSVFPLEGIVWSLIHPVGLVARKVAQEADGVLPVGGVSWSFLFDFIDVSRTKLFLGSTKSRHLPPASWVDGALARKFLLEPLCLRKIRR